MCQSFTRRFRDSPKMRYQQAVFVYLSQVNFRRKFGAQSMPNNALIRQEGVYIDQRQRQGILKGVIPWA